jgi:hypothetical protein
MDNKDSLANLVSKVKEMVKASQVKVLVKDSRMVRTNMVMDSNVTARTTDMVISLVKDSLDRGNLVMVVLKHRDKAPEMDLVMNVVVDKISLD